MLHCQARVSQMPRQWCVAALALRLSRFGSSTHHYFYCYEYRKEPTKVHVKHVHACTQQTPLCGRQPSPRRPCGLVVASPCAALSCVVLLISCMVLLTSCVALLGLSAVWPRSVSSGHATRRGQLSGHSGAEGCGVRRHPTSTTQPHAPHAYAYMRSTVLSVRRSTPETPDWTYAELQL